MYRGKGIVGSTLLPSPMSDDALTRLICKNSIPSIFLFPFHPRSRLRPSLQEDSLSSLSFYVALRPAPLSSQPLPFSGSSLRFCFVSGRPFIEDRTYFKNIKSVRSLLERPACPLLLADKQLFHPWKVSFPPPFLFFLNDRIFVTCIFVASPFLLIRSFQKRYRHFHF